MNYYFIIWISLVNERNTAGYVEERLTDALSKELEYVQERTYWEEQTKQFFGEKMFESLKQKNEMREQALVSDQGEQIFTTVY